MNNQIKHAFFKSEKAEQLQKLLLAMTEDPAFNTHVPGITDRPEDERFIEKHMLYMCKYPQMDHYQYISNLKLKTRITKPLLRGL